MLKGEPTVLKQGLPFFVHTAARETDEYRLHFSIPPKPE